MGNPNPAPLPVTGLTDAVALAAGDNHTCALLADGAARCWGENLYGQLGDPSTSGTTSNPMPLAVTGITDAVALAAGAVHTCARLADGAARCWGWNRYGQLGNPTNSGTNNPNPAPLAVMPFP
jgi:alpha-tubulin suppressor-like RCC1 family protein